MKKWCKEPLLHFLVIGVVLLFHPPLRFLDRYASSDAPGQNVEVTSRVILRVGLALIGVFLICRALTPSVELIVTAVTSKAPLSWRFRRTVITSAISVGIQIILGAYLLSGAPDLVRWQMKRIFGKPIPTEQSGTEDEPADRAPSN